MIRGIVTALAGAAIIAILVLDGPRSSHAVPVALPEGPARSPPRGVVRGETPESGMTILVLRLGARGLSLVSATEKPVRSECSSEGDGAWVLEDAATGERLALGPCDLPHLCTCPIGRDHAHGCAVIRHEAVFRVKVPRLAPRERLRILDASGRELATFVLESNP